MKPTAVYILLRSVATNRRIPTFSLEMVDCTAEIHLLDKDQYGDFELVDCGGRVLCGLLERNSTLKHLRLGFRSLVHSGLDPKASEKAASLNTSLTSLVLSD